MKKKIIIGVLIAALIAGGTVGGAVYYRKSHQSEVSVVSVDSLASQYYTDDTSLEGNVATSAVQNVSIDKDMIVQDIYVSKGDTVKKGDKLVSAHIIWIFIPAAELLDCFTQCIKITGCRQHSLILFRCGISFCSFNIFSYCAVTVQSTAKIHKINFAGFCAHQVLWF